VWAADRTALEKDQSLVGLIPPPRRLFLKRRASLSQAHPGTDWLFLLVQGRLRVSRLTMSGRKLELTQYEPGAFFFGSHVAQGVAEAIADCVLRVLSRAHVEDLLRRRPDFGLELLQALDQRLLESEERLEYLAYHSVSARVALALLRLRRPEDGLIPRITHQELGDIVGAYRETVTKVLRSFECAGHIEVAHRSITVRNPVALADLLDI
jgi:CRP-like cAMP-binding protein